MNNNISTFINGNNTNIKWTVTTSSVGENVSNGEDVEVTDIVKFANFLAKTETDVLVAYLGSSSASLIINENWRLNVFKEKVEVLYSDVWWLGTKIPEPTFDVLMEVYRNMRKTMEDVSKFIESVSNLMFLRGEKKDGRVCVL